MTKYRYRGRDVDEDEALDERGSLRDGYAVTVPMTMRDGGMTRRVAHLLLGTASDTLGGLVQNGGETAIDGPTFLSTIGWDWIPAIRDRDTGIWQKVFLSASGPVLIKDPLVTTDLPLPRIDSADIAVQAGDLGHAQNRTEAPASAGPTARRMWPNSSRPKPCCRGRHVAGARRRSAAASTLISSTPASASMRMMSPSRT